MTKFSIILPVYNGGNYVKECIRSILSQTVADFELLVLDNASNDGTYEWINSLNDARITIIRSQKVLSIEENWSRVISTPRSEFMTLIGHDDLLDPTYLEEMQKLVEWYPDATLYQAHFRFINSEGQVTGKCRPMHSREDEATFLKSLLTDTIDTMGTGYMMRSADYDKVGGMPSYPNLLFADHSLWLSLTELGYKATSSAECFSYRVHQSVSRMTSANRYIKSFYFFAEFLEREAKRDPAVFEALQQDGIPYIQYYCRSLAHRLLKTPVQERGGMTVSGFISHCRKIAERLCPGQRFRPLSAFNVLAAALIDSNRISRSAYLAFRKRYTKPVNAKRIRD